jgi:hypothetical protein
MWINNSPDPLTASGIGGTPCLRRKLSLILLDALAATLRAMVASPDDPACLSGCVIFSTEGMTAPFIAM